MTKLFGIVSDTDSLPDELVNDKVEDGDVCRFTNIILILLTPVS
jgi:hypothetical protein